MNNILSIEGLNSEMTESTLKANREKYTFFLIDGCPTFEIAQQHSIIKSTVTLAR